jgi:hypothetical protein
MSRQTFPLRIAAIVVLLVAALGLGYGVKRWWWGDSSPPARPPEEPDAPLSKAGPRRALLVGVTKYDNLPERCQLSGPANDVGLMRRLLQERYHFPADCIVTLTENEGTPARRPTRANIEREFHRLATASCEGDQVVILMAGHGCQQPESVPPHPEFPEPDGLDQVFLPADVSKGKGSPVRVPNAIVDDDLGAWLRAITAKKAHVWIIFDCCHSGTMTRGTEVMRELPPGTLVPQEELDRARQRAEQRGTARGGSPLRPSRFVARGPSDYLVALYACRSHEKTPEGPQPPESPGAQNHGLLTYSLADILTKSATSKAPLTYRELVQRIQLRYAARPQGAPTPTVEGRGQDRVVLGHEQPARPRLLLTRDGGAYKVNAGDLYGLTAGSVLAVHSPAGAEKEPRLLGHVRVRATRPFDSTVEPCAYQKWAVVKELPPLSACEPVLIDYGLRRFKVAVQAPEGPARQQLLKALAPLCDPKEGVAELVSDLARAEWLVRLEKGRAQLVEASGNRAPFALPAADSPELAAALRRDLGRVFRARNLIGLSNRFEAERYRGRPAVDVEVEVLRHAGPGAPGKVWPRPTGGWVFRPGDLISFRIHNRSATAEVDVALLIVGSDFQISPFYPKQGDPGKSLRPGQSLDTPPPPGEISSEPPFGPECLVVIAAPAKAPPVDFSALAQEGLAVERSPVRRSPLGELLEQAMHRTGQRGSLPRRVAEQHGMRALTWRTERK